MINKSPLYNTIAKGIIDGLHGLNKGIPSQNSLITDYLCGITRGTYYLVGAELGCGKTAFIDEAFVTSAYEHMAKTNSLNKLKIIYFSFEIRFVKKLVKMLCRKIFLDHGQYIDLNTMLSRGNGYPSSDIVTLADTYQEYFNKMDEVLVPIEYSMNGNEVVKKLYEISCELGTWDGEDINSNYKINDPEMRVVVIIDHVGLVKKNRFADKKNTLDELSEYAVRLRNKCNFTFVMTSQLNRDHGKRERPGKGMFGPQLSDFKDTGNTQEDAEVVMAIYNPNRHKVKEFRGYNVEELGKYFRTIHILKHRDGEEDICKGYLLNGGVGHFKEIQPHNIA